MYAQDDLLNCGTFSEQDMLDLPWVTVDVNFHFMPNTSSLTYSNDPSGIFGSGQWFGNTMIQRANDFFQNVQQNALPGQNGQQAPAIPNGSVKIKFELRNLYFYEPGEPFEPEGNQALDIEVFDNSGCGFAGGNDGSGLGNGTIAKLRNYFCNNINLENDDVAIKSFVHEVLHTFGLHHSHCPSEPCADIDPQQECSNTNTGTPNCGANSCLSFTNGNMSNNVMNGNSWFGRAITPCQLARIYNHFALVDFTNFSFDDGCEKNQPPLYLNADGTILWDNPKILYRDVVVETGTNLIISCAVMMAKDAKIRVRRGARLILEGGYITSICKDEFWGGIVVNGNSNKHHEAYMADKNASLLSDDPGVFHSFGGFINKAVTGISTHRCCAPWEEQLAGRGGLIIAEGTTFENCRKGIEFLEYEHQNFSILTDCEFKSDRGYAGVTVYKCHGITFDNCDFEDMGIPENLFITQPDDVGILAIQSGITVHNQSDFERLGMGIGIFNNSPFLSPNPVLIGSLDDNNPNIFVNNNHHIRGEETDNVLVENNFFQGNDEFIHHVVFGSVHFSNSSEFKIENNSFLGANIQVNNNKNRVSEINNNYFDISSIIFDFGAIRTVRRNDEITFDLNCFNSTNRNDIVFHSNESTLRHVQGTPQFPRFNSFSENHNPKTDYSVRIHPDPTLGPYQYFYHPDAPDGNPSLIPRCGLLNFDDNICSGNPLNFEAKEAAQAQNAPNDDLANCLQIDGFIDPDPPVCSSYECLKEVKEEWDKKSDFVDGGDTQSLIDVIENAPQQSSTVDLLTEASPYLSHQILNLLIQSSMNENDKQNILLKNAPLSKALKNNLENNLSTESVEELAVVEETTLFSDKLILDIEIDELRNSYYKIFDERLNQLALAKDYDAIEETLNFDDSPRARRMLFGLHN